MTTQEKYDWALVLLKEKRQELAKYEIGRDVALRNEEFVKSFGTPMRQRMIEKVDKLVSDASKAVEAVLEQIEIYKSELNK